MEQTEFPLIISPNLGCPEIVSVEELKKGKTIRLIMAGQYGEFASPLRREFEGALYLRSPDGGETEISLSIMDDPKEITDWNLLSAFSNIGATREIINSELHYNILGEGTRYWKIDVSIKDDHGALLRRNRDKQLPGLFDLVFKDKSNKWEKVNYHAIQFVQDFRSDFNFLHLTDPHAAKRNDEILAEVLKVRGRRERKEIEKSYINFNQNLREFIRVANDMADEGKLHFVVVTGDLVDFAFHGWEEEPNPDENNWKTFISIVTGTGTERARGNPGLKVAIFTSTGNHDWRLHPYDPSKWGRNESFGLTEDELKQYDYKSFDSEEYPEDERARLTQKLTNKAFDKLNTAAFDNEKRVKLKRLLSRFLSSRFTPWITRVLACVGLGGAGFAGYMEQFIVSGGILLLELLIWLGRKYIKRKAYKLVDLILNNPLRAEAKALHYYFKHINPYLDYAFQYGDHSFIVMDTGADVFVGQLLDGEQTKYLKKLSFQDNVFGGAPDSRAFDSEQSYYNWSQIVWLEKVLSILDGRDTNGDKKTFVFLHAPPINPKASARLEWSSFWERRRKQPGWIPESECNLTYGTINHYLSQFFYLCIGCRESELVKEKPEPSFRKVDIVFSGHTHVSMEFRIAREWVESDNKYEVRIYSDVYSDLLDHDNLDQWWKEHTPIIVQTPSCGPKGKTCKAPPYFRKVTIDDRGHVTDFRVMNSRAVV
jgi:predicted MPP superfamily phosphohydrolase